MRRTVYELLAEFGYKDGVVPYISNMYKDAAKNSGHNLSRLKEIEIEWEGKNIKVNNIKLEELMKNAVNKDLELINQNRKPKYVDELKKVVYKKYFNITNEFRESIYN